MTEVEVTTYCSKDCEGRWGTNCLTHWVDGGFDRIINDVKILNELAKDPSSWLHITRKSETGGPRDIMLLEVRGLRILVTEYDNLEVRQTDSYRYSPKIEFIRKEN